VFFFWGEFSHCVDKKKVESFGFFLLKKSKFEIIALKKWGKNPKHLKPQNSKNKIKKITGLSHWAAAMGIMACTH
jgi:hypothetical protein